MDRVSGVIMGALIGDALGLGCHWYYDLAQLRKDYGPWVDNYTTPRPDRYHGGLKAGQLSQTGLIFVMLLRSVAENGEYREEDFTRRLDEELFPMLNGTPVYGPGGYTSQSIREAYRRRVEQKKRGPCRYLGSGGALYRSRRPLCEPAAKGCRDSFGQLSSYARR
ncbi:MAG: ADP-ribosylglycohydrolase family protein [Nitrosospira sp.]